MQPLVTVIVPTSNRFEMLVRCVQMYDAQDYPHKEIIIVYDDMYRTCSNVQGLDIPIPPCREIGTKRNVGIRAAHGDIILHMDDDDIYLPNYISTAVRALHQSKLPLVGLHKFPIHNVRTGDVYMFDNPGYIAEATFCYWKDGFCGFPDTSKGEGAHVLRNMHYASYTSDTFMATVHGGNTCGHTALPLIKKLHPELGAAILNNFYTMPDR